MKLAMSSPIRRLLASYVERVPIAYDDNPEEFDRLHLDRDSLANMSTPILHDVQTSPVGSNENAGFLRQVDVGRQSILYTHLAEIRTVPAFGRMCGDAKGTTRASATTNDSGGMRGADSTWRGRLLAVRNRDAVCNRLHVNSLIVKVSPTVL